jgi:O-antigen/teichoic acid export membrane protein
VNKIFGLKTFVGLFLSFFFLCYVFSFRLIYVVPLLFAAFLIYAVMSLGHKYFIHYIKIIRTEVRRRIRRTKEKNDENNHGGDYRLMEI